MKSTFLLSALLLLLCGLVWAESSEGPILGPNKLRNNNDVTTYRQNDKGIPTYVEGTLSDQKSAGTEVDAAFSYFEEHRGAYRMVSPSEELKVRRVQTDNLGMQHVRLDQQYKGIPVIGGNLIAHFSADNVLKTVNGFYHHDIDLDIKATVASAAAVDIAERDLLSFFGAAEPDEPELVVFPWEDQYYLCWRLFLFSNTPMGRWEYFVDATNGEVVFNANRIMNENDIGTGYGVMGGFRDHIDTRLEASNYAMKDFTRRADNNPHGHNGQMPMGNYIQTNIAGGSLPGSVATDADNFWDDAASQRPAVDGHVYSALVYDWMLSQWGRNSFDDAGASMLTSVNYYAEGNNNAYWNGNQIVIWSWSSGWRSLAGCPDVIAHEWGHAVTDYCSDLVYQLEPGALNESFSDMMGAAFEWAHPTYDTPDWYMGENGMTSGNGFRSMDNPHMFGDPDFYGTSDPYWVDVVGCTPSWTNDYCGVHTNSGVGNKWFSLLSDGGVHHSVTVTGIGVDNAMLIAYRANQLYWNSQTDYHAAALGTISAATDLDPTGVWTTQVANAWNAVGVSTPGPSLTFSYPSGVPSIIPPETPQSFEIVINGTLGGEMVTNSGYLHYSLDGGAYIDQPLQVMTSTRFKGTLPSAPCESMYEFYVSAEEVSSGIKYDPDPSSPHTAIVADSVIYIFEDDCETDLGWTVSGNATDGQWERGIPVGGGDRGDPPTDYDGSGYCYLTDNVDDNSDVDDGTTYLDSPIFDLSDGDAEISYARWYSNNFGASPYADEMVYALILGQRLRHPHRSDDASF
jgi:Zn-dependent metalloprotease